MRPSLFSWVITALAMCAGAQTSGCLFPSLDDLSACEKGCDEPSPCDLTADMRGPAGVHIVPPGELPAFCIDATEVSVGQYRSFYQEAVFPLSASLFPEQCDWKANEREAFGPLGKDEYGKLDSYVWDYYDGKTQENRPVIGVDWCDAAIFCRWAKKRLCGSEQPEERHIDSSKSNWTRTGEWFRACGGPEGLPFGYGSKPEDGKCNDNGGPAQGDSHPFNTTDVTEPSSCVAAWPDGPVYNMNGNIQEHEDNCDDGTGMTFADDRCYPRGGVYLFEAQDMPCEYAEQKADSVYNRGRKAEHTGFRCCW
jgi:formylglycine-generating enzyme